MRALAASSIALLLLACNDPCAGTVEHEGAPLWGTTPGLCPGHCADQQLNLDGDAVQLVISGEDTCQLQGTLAPELVDSIAALTDELSMGADVGEPDPACANLPDVGGAWLELAGVQRWSYRRGCPPAALVELDAQLEAVALGLYECQANEWVTPDDDCQPIE